MTAAITGTTLTATRSPIRAGGILCPLAPYRERANFVKVVDYENSERGPQRRKDAHGRLLHCCCICGACEIWSATWSYYGSVKQLDDGEVLPKFCSNKCRAAGGTAAANVTQ